MTDPAWRARVRRAALWGPWAWQATVRHGRVELGHVSAWSLAGVARKARRVPRHRRPV